MVLSESVILFASRAKLVVILLIKREFHRLRNKGTMPEQSKYQIPNGMLARYKAIVDLTDAFCRAHLDDKYADLCRKLTAKLSRKRPSPLMRGRPRNWAGAILYTIGRLNFLFDKSQTPHLGAKQLCESVGVRQNTASGKSTEIMRLLKIGPFEPEWTRPSKLDESVGVDDLSRWLYHRCAQCTTGDSGGSTKNGVDTIPAPDERSVELIRFIPFSLLSLYGEDLDSREQKGMVSGIIGLFLSQASPETCLRSTLATDRKQPYA